MNQTLKENTEAVEQMRKSMNASTKAVHGLKQTQKMTKEAVDEMKESLKKNTEAVEVMKQSLKKIRMRLRGLRQFSANEFTSGLKLAYSYPCISWNSKNLRFNKYFTHNLILFSIIR